jgi:hypothetical protein
MGTRKRIEVTIEPRTVLRHKQPGRSQEVSSTPLGFNRCGYWKRHLRALHETNSILLESELLRVTPDPAKCPTYKGATTQ